MQLSWHQHPSSRVVHPRAPPSADYSLFRDILRTRNNFKNYSNVSQSRVRWMWNGNPVHSIFQFEVNAWELQSCFRTNDCVLITKFKSVRGGILRASLSCRLVGRSPVAPRLSTYSSNWTGMAEPEPVDGVKAAQSICSINSICRITKIASHMAQEGVVLLCSGSI